MNLNPLSTYHRLAIYIAQWLERVYGKREVAVSNPTRANFLYGVEKP